MSKENPTRPPVKSAQSKEAALRRQKQEALAAKQAKKREKKRKWRRRGRIALVLMPFVLLLSLVAGGLYVAHKYLRLEDYSATGGVHYSAHELFAHSGLRKGEGLLTAPVRAARQTLPQALPYLESVTIERKLPHTVVFHVQEVQTIYSATQGADTTQGDWLLLSGKTKVLEQTTAPQEGTLRLLLPAWEKATPGQLLVFRTDEETNQTLHVNLEKLLTAIAAGVMAQDITALDMRDPNAIALLYQDTVTLKLGAVADLDSRLSWANNILTDLQKDGPLQRGSLDMTLEKPVFHPYDE